MRLTTRSKDWMIGLVLIPVPVIGFLLLWELASRSFGVPQLFPGPRVTAHTLMDLVGQGIMWNDARASLIRIVLGFVVGSAIGVLLGLVCDASRLVADIVTPYINFLRFISGVAWISIFIVWFGIGETSKIVVIAYTVAFTVALAVMGGLSETTLNRLRVAAMFGASPRQVFFGIRIPMLVRSTINGMRLSLTNAFLVIVAAEMVQSDSGLGFAIIAARNFLAPDVIFAVMLVIGVLGFLADRGFVVVTQLFLNRYVR
jgi:NitT/TauT family transport system permease protein